MADEAFAADHVVDKEKQLKQLDTTVKSSTKTAVCLAISVGRVIEDREILANGENASPTGAIVVVFKPDHSTMGGHGEVFRRLKETGVLSGFPGEGTKAATSDDLNYNEAPLRLMEFHETFKDLKNDVDKNKFFRAGVDKVLRVPRGKCGKYKPRKKNITSAAGSSQMLGHAQSATISVSVQVSQFQGQSNEMDATDFKEQPQYERPQTGQAQNVDNQPLPLKKRKITGNTLFHLETGPGNAEAKSVRKQSPRKESKKSSQASKENTELHFAVQQDSPMFRELFQDNEGYSGSQEKTPTVSLEDSQDQTLFSHYFNDTPSLNDVSFHLMCAQACGLTEDKDCLPFENV